MNSDKFEVHQPISEPIKAIDALYCGVDKFLTEKIAQGQFDSDFRLSKQQLKLAMNKGAVWLTDGKQTNRLRRAAKPLKAEQTIHLYYDAKVLNAEVPQGDLLLDKKHYSLWYKPKGMLSQGSKWADHCTIVRFAQTQFSPERQGFIVHRLDRATDGIIVVGHSKSATRQLCDLFACGLINKRYLAVVSGHFPDKVDIDLPIDDKQALSHCFCREYCPKTDLSLVEIKIDTGRKHQIRRHLSALGFPIVGDRLHGNGEQGVDLQLTAFSIEFKCPLENQPVSVNLPQELWPNLENVNCG